LRGFCDALTSLPFPATALFAKSPSFVTDGLLLGTEYLPQIFSNAIALTAQYFATLHQLFTSLIAEAHS
jgi:hypothetical protein